MASTAGKATSVLLMAIMVAGGLTFAIPGVQPAMAQSSNPNLAVSAESSAFGNYFAGAQVVEVVIIDPDIDETNEQKGEPDVTIGGNKLRMVQATDGKWYAYVADRVHAGRADGTVANANVGEGLDFGTICTPDEAEDVFRAALGSANANLDYFSDARAVAFPFSVQQYVVASGTPATTSPVSVNASCADSDPPAIDNTDQRYGAFTDVPATLPTADGTYYYRDTAINVVREAKAINDGQKLGQSIEDGGADVPDANRAGLWPFIQLFDFNPTGSVNIVYNRGGGSQSVSLNYDTVDGYASLSLDRTTYPQSSQVHFEITDTWLDIDPTDEDSWTWDVEGPGAGSVYYQAFDENGMRQGDTPSISSALSSLMCDNNCRLLLDRDVQGTNVVEFADNEDSDPGLTSTLVRGEVRYAADGLLTVTETSATSGVFTSYDEADASVLQTSANAPRDFTATIDYNETPQSISVGYSTASIDIQPTGDVWLSGQEIPIVLTDADANQNSRADEDLSVSNPDHIIPVLVTGDPVMAHEAMGVLTSTASSSNVSPSGETMTYGSGNRLNAGTGPAPNFAPIAPEFAPVDGSADSLGGAISGERLGMTRTSFGNPQQLLILQYASAPVPTSHYENRQTVTTLLNYDFSSFAFQGISEEVDIYTLAHTGPFTGGQGSNTHLQGTANMIVSDGPLSGYVEIPDGALRALSGDNPSGSDYTNFGLLAYFGAHDGVTTTGFTLGGGVVIADIVSFGFTGDGEDAGERVANQVVRLELEETGDNTGVFEGSLEYAMVNQLTIAESSTYTGLAPIDDEATLIAIEDLTDEDTLTVTYDDVGRDGVVTFQSDDEAAISHSGTVSLDATSYKIADTVTVTLRDADLNTSSDTTEVYTIQAGSDHVGRAGGVYATTHDFGTLGRLADITFDDSAWVEGACGLPSGSDNGLRSTGFTLRETSAASGVFEGDFQIPSQWCAPGASAPESVTGLDIEVNYVDYRDASGEIIEVGDAAGIRANTGSVSLDRPVYPVPFGDQVTVPAGSGTGAGSHFKTYSAASPTLAAHDVTVHVRVTDPDFDVSASGTDTLGQDVTRSGGEGDGYGPLKITVRRGADEAVLGYAGGSEAQSGPARAVVLQGATVTAANAIDHGPLTETAPSSGTFELDLGISWDHGPASTECPGGLATSSCILQGDILFVEYTDPADASGNQQTVTDSATFDMRNAVLRSDKSVYIIGSDMILTLIEPDLDLDNDTAETYPLSLIEWDDDDSVTDLLTDSAAFDPEPTSLRETGDSTGIFQVVVEIPQAVNGDDLERGEEIELEYQDWSPAGADYVGQTDEEIQWSIFTSDFGATIELDQAVYTWTDKVFITIVAPDHNFDSNLIDEIGDTPDDPLQISTREGGSLTNYRLSETGTDTGIFSGEVILTGFEHDADGDASTGTNGNDRTNLPSGGRGPTDGTIAADDDDGITVSYEYNDDEHVIGSALIRWNVGDTQWLEASYPASGSGVVRIVDPDMNLNPESVDNFEVDVFSDADAGGINLTVTETQEASGIFEGTVIFTLNDQSSGHRLRVAEGDTVTARYDDNTLPDPYTRNDELEVEGTTIIGTLVPPLERAVVSNVRLTDNSGNPLDTVAVGQQVQVTGQVTSGQEVDQAYAYLVQINDSNDVTLSLTWTSGTLNAGQSLSPSMSWQPAEAGEYTATVFVWESIDNPTALSPQVELPFTVS